jgi:Nidogen-like
LSSLTKKLLLLPTLLGALLLTAGSAQAAGVGAVEALDGCVQHTYTAGEDAYESAGLGFSVNFYGTIASNVSVNENGNVTLDDVRTDFAPVDFTTASDVMIAPFLADVALSGPGKIKYGNGIDGTTKYFCVDWSAVGHYGHTEAAGDTFQLLLTQSPAEAVHGDFTITFNYDAIGWSGGTSRTDPAAAVGFSAGDGIAGHSHMQPGSFAPGELLDANATMGLIHNSYGSGGTPGRYVFPVVNGDPPADKARLTGWVVEHDYSTPALYVPVQLCPVGGGPCTTRATNDLGHFTAAGLTPGDYDVTAFPRADDDTARTVRVPLVAGDNTPLELDLADGFGTPPVANQSVIGRVVDTLGRPVTGAAVTLLRAATPGGPFIRVLDGSPEMSVANRANPDATTLGGAFGWNAVAGYYQVEASKRGCVSARSAVVAVPHAGPDLVVRLLCGEAALRPPTTGGGGTGDRGASVRQAVAASLSAQLGTVARRAARRLAAHNVKSFVLPISFAAPGVAVLRIRAAGQRVAAGRLVVGAAGRAKLTVKLTTRGRALLRSAARHHRRVRLQLSLSFAPRVSGSALAAVRGTRRFSVRPG